MVEIDSWWFIYDSIYSDLAICSIQSDNSSWIFIAVVNLTLVDLPGLTKVAVVMFLHSHVIGLP